LRFPPFIRASARGYGATTGNLKRELVNVVVDRSGESRKREGRGGRALALLATVLAPLVLYAIVRTAAVAVSPAAAITLPPLDYTPLLRPLTLGLIDPRVPVRPEYLTMAKSSVRAEPLAFEPFIILARKAGDEGDLRRAILLTEEAYRRRPNFLATRLMLMNYYAKAGRPAEAVREMDYVLRYNEAARQLVLPELLKLLRDGDARRALAPVLATNPGWREELVRVAQERDIDPEHARDLYSLVRAARPVGGTAPELRLYLQALVRSGRAVEARAIWLQGLPPAQRGPSRYIFDGAFNGARGSAPFAWVLSDADTGRAEIKSDSRPPSLEVNYFGGKNAVLAEQLLGLPPAAYRISFRARSAGGAPSGTLSWLLSCLSDGRELGRVAIKAPPPAYRTYQGDLAVPASGCSGQRLRLVAEPGDIAAAITVEIADLQVVSK
jgi:tetratricopeptide (TPR) repeat protein